MAQIDLDGFDLALPGGRGIHGELDEGFGEDVGALPAAEPARRRPRGRPTVEGGAAAAPPEGELQIMCLDDILEAEPIPPKPGVKYKRRSVELLQHARDAKAMKRAETKELALKTAMEGKDLELRLVKGALPEAAALLGQRRTQFSRRKKEYGPSDFILLSRACHFKSSKHVKVGVKFKRLTCAASRLLLARQAKALARMLQLSRDALRAHGHGRCFGHLTYCHVWDGVRVKYRSRKKTTSYRAKQGASSSEIIVQRGVLTTTLGDSSTGGVAQDWQPWVCQPKRAAGTGAHQIWLAVRDAMPDEFRIDKPAKMNQIAASGLTATLVWLSDMASGNVLMMARLFLAWVAQPIPGTLLWLDHCQIHVHNRCKLAVKLSKRHTIRRYSIASLERQGETQARMMMLYETLIPSLLTRRFGPPPEQLGPTVALVADILWKTENAKFHKTKKNNDTQFLADMKEMGTIVNGDLTGERIHFCYDANTARPCCRSARHMRERAMTAIVNGLNTKSVSTPAENTWTHVLENYKITLMRRFVYSVGIRAWDLDAKEPTTSLNIDDAAASEFYKVLQATRRLRTQEYYTADENFIELTMITIPLDIFDSRLQGPLFGDPTPELDQAKRSKLERLLHPDDSLIGKCLSELYLLLDTWLKAC